MLRLTLDLLRKGNPRDTERLGTLEIHNLTGVDSPADYGVKLRGSIEADGTLRGHPRDVPAWHHVAAALRVVLGATSYHVRHEHKDDVLACAVAGAGLSYVEAIDCFVRDRTKLMRELTAFLSNTSTPMRFVIPHDDDLASKMLDGRAVRGGGEMSIDAARRAVTHLESEGHKVAQIIVPPKHEMFARRRLVPELLGLRNEAVIRTKLEVHVRTTVADSWHLSA